MATPKRWRSFSPPCVRFRHDFGRGTNLVFLIAEAAGEGGGNGLFLSEFRGGGCLAVSKAGDQKGQSDEEKDDDADGR